MPWAESFHVEVHSIAGAAKQCGKRRASNQPGLGSFNFGLTCLFMAEHACMEA